MTQTYVIVPSYHPTDALVELTHTICALGYRLIVVDDGGGDADSAVYDALDPRTVILHHAVNRGKGAALKTGLAYVRSQLLSPTEGGDSSSVSPTDTVAFMDADGQESPEDLEAVLTAARSPMARYKLSIGVCAMEKKKYLLPRIGHAITCGVFHLLVGAKLSHAFTCLRACPTAYIDKLLEIEGDRYEYEINVMAYFARHEAGFCEVPIRDGEIRPQKNFRMIRDSLRVVGSLIRFMGSSLSSYLVEYTCFCLLSFLFGKQFPMIGDLFANICARIIGGTVNYLINCFIVFRRRPSWQSASQFALLNVVTLSLNSGALYLWKLTPFPVQICKLLADTSMFIVNYLIQRKFIFRKKKKTNTDITGFENS